MTMGSPFDPEIKRLREKLARLDNRRPFVRWLDHISARVVLWMLHEWWLVNAIIWLIVIGCALYALPEPEAHRR